MVRSIGALFQQVRHADVVGAPRPDPGLDRCPDFIRVYVAVVRAVAPDHDDRIADL